MTELKCSIVVIEAEILGSSFALHSMERLYVSAYLCMMTYSISLEGSALFPLNLMRALPKINRASYTTLALLEVFQVCS